MKAILELKWSNFFKLAEDWVERHEICFVCKALRHGRVDNCTIFDDFTFWNFYFNEKWKSNDTFKGLRH